MFDIDRLSPAAKAEAMRVGNSAVINNDQLEPFLQEVAPFLLENESFTVKPLGTIAGSIHMFSVRILPRAIITRVK